MRYRSYRSTGYYSGYFPPGVKWLLISNAAVFVFQQFAAAFFQSDPFKLLVLVPAMVLQLGAVWQPFTYMFLHAGVWHIVLNMLMLWMFGLELERDWGTRRFLKYYFVCGVGAAICVIIVSLIRPPEMMKATLGASGAIFGLLLAYGVMYSERIILVMFLFPMQAKYAVMLFGAIEFLGTWRPSTGVSHIAHLGGMLFGYVYLKTRLVRFRFDPVEWARGRVQEWKLQRARKKFQVYMKKQQSDRDRWVH